MQTNRLGTVLAAMLFSVSAAFVVTGCGKREGDGREAVTGKVVDRSKLVVRNNLVYEVNSEKPFTGRVVNSRTARRDLNQPIPKSKDQKDNLILWFYMERPGDLEIEFSDGKPHGKWTDWHENGQKKSELNFRNGNKHGKEYFWHENGQLQREVDYRNDRPHGKWIQWYENGRKMSEEEYRNGKNHGILIEWYENGQKQSESLYRDDVEISWIGWDRNGKQIR